MQIVAESHIFQAPLLTMKIGVPQKVNVISGTYLAEQPVKRVVMSAIAQ
jgi:hypothetical protein